MDDKTAIGILFSLEKKYSLTDEEKEAISNATGILSWSTLAQSRIKSLKSKKEK